MPGKHSSMEECPCGLAMVENVIRSVGRSPSYAANHGSMHSWQDDHCHDQVVGHGLVRGRGPRREEATRKVADGCQVAVLKLPKSQHSSGHRTGSLHTEFPDKNVQDEQLHSLPPSRRAIAAERTRGGGKRRGCQV